MNNYRKILCYYWITNWLSFPTCSPIKTADCILLTSGLSQTSSPQSISVGTASKAAARISTLRAMLETLNCSLSVLLSHPGLTEIAGYLSVLMSQT
jgi:hypothetical protein